MYNIHNYTAACELIFPSFTFVLGMLKVIWGV
jgi:hypothetical protein